MNSVNRTNETGDTRFNDEGIPQFFVVDRWVTMELILDAKICKKSKVIKILEAEFEDKWPEARKFFNL